MFVVDKANTQKDSELSVEMTSYDSKWLSELSKTAERDLFTGLNGFQWNNYIERILQPRN